MKTKLQFYTSFLFFFLFIGLHTTIAQSNNDFCSGATEISCGQIVNGTLSDATQDSELDNCAFSGLPSNSKDGKWYKIQGNNKIIEITGCTSSSDPFFSVFEGDCNNLTCIENYGFCSNNRSKVSFFATAGKDYLINFHSYHNADFEFEVSCRERPSNITCSASSTISCGETIVDTTYLALNFDAPPCVDFTSTEKGLWYKIVGNGQTMNIACESEHTSIFSLFTGTDCNSLSCINSAEGNCGGGATLVFDSELGKEYFLNVSTRFNFGRIEFSVSCGAAPANQVCVNAVPISCEENLTVSTKFIAIERVIPFCFGNLESTGLWYEIQGNNEMISLSTTPNSYGLVAVFNDDCNNLSCIDYQIGQYGAEKLSVNFFGDLGTTYKLFVGSNGGKEFQLDIRCGPIASNDECGNAKLLSCETSAFKDSIYFALDEQPVNCDVGISEDHGLWYKFTGTGDFFNIKLCQQEFYGRMYLFEGPCIETFNCPTERGNHIHYLCSNWFDNEINFQSEIGKEYFLLVSSIEGQGTFEINIECTEPAINDEIENALSIYCGQSIAGNNLYATTDTNLPSCQSASNLSNGLWYKFEGNGENVSFNTCQTNFKAEIAAFSGSPNNLVCVDYGHLDSETTRISCPNSSYTEPYVEFFAQMGQTYYILIRTNGNSPGAFTLNFESENCSCDSYPSMINLDAVTLNSSIHTNGNIQSTIDFDINYDFTMMAGQTITLLPGFHAGQGGSFTAKIEDCNNSFIPEVIPSQARIKQLEVPKISPHTLTVFPNPFQNKTTIQYQLNTNQNTSLVVYSITGQLIEQFAANTFQNAGTYNYEFSSKQLKEGMYFVVLQTATERISQKVILFK